MKKQGTLVVPAPIVSIGEKIVVDDLRMTCTAVVLTLDGTEYEFDYFPDGRIETWRVPENKLRAIGFERDGGRREAKGFVPAQGV